MHSPTSPGTSPGTPRHNGQERTGYSSRRASTLSVDTRGQVPPHRTAPTPRAPSMDLTAMPGTPRGQHAVRNTAAAQSSPAAAEASTADKLRWALIVLRLLQLGACAFNGWSAGGDAMMLTNLAKYRGIYLPGVVLYLIIILCVNTFTAVLTMSWLLLTVRPAWRQRCSWCLGVTTIAPYTADFVWDFILGCCWLVALLALVMQHRYLPIPLAATSLLTALFWSSGGVAFALRVRLTQQQAGSRQDDREAAVQVQVTRQHHGEQSKGAFAALVALSSPRSSSRPSSGGRMTSGSSSSPPPPVGRVGSESSSSRSQRGRSTGVPYRAPPQLHP